MKPSASLQSFSDQELHHQALALAQKERATTLTLLKHLSEIFSRCLVFYLEKQDPMRRKKTEPKPKPSISKDKVALPAKWKSRATQQRGLFPKNREKETKVARRSRYISQNDKQIVRARSGHQCEYVDPTTQRRCESRYLLQVDHVKPYACGGSSDLNNLRMLCAVHNQFLAEEVFGKNLPFGTHH